MQYESSILSSLACPALHYVSIYLINGTISEKKSYWTKKKCVVIFSTNLLEIFLVLGRTERDIIKNVHCSSRKALVILLRFSLNLNFLDGFSKSTQISNLIISRSVGAELFHMDRRTDEQTDMTEPIVAFAVFRTSPKTGTKSGTKLNRKRSPISVTVSEYPGRIMNLL